MALPWGLPVRAGLSPIVARRFAELDCAVDDFRPVCLLLLPLLCVLPCFAAADSAKFANIEGRGGRPKS